MNLPQRIQTALREDGNIVALAGAAALSLALLNPIPLLIGLVVETVYLLYVPDSRWYANHLSARYDGEVKSRRNKLKAERFADAPDSAIKLWATREAMRETIGEHAEDTPEWLTFLRRLDFLLDLQIQAEGTAAQIMRRIRQFAWVGGDADPVAAGEARISYYESMGIALQNVLRGTPAGASQAEVQANIAQVERQKTDTQKELFQVVAAQHLTDAVHESTKETLRFLVMVRDAKEGQYLAWWGEDAVRLTHESETLVRRLSDWLKQTK